MSLLLEIAALIAAAVVAVPLFQRLGLGSVLGYLAAGVALGPTGLDLFGHPEELLHFAEFGVVMLMFLIGLELQPARLWAMRRAVFGVGSAQVLATGLVVGLGLWALGATGAEAVVLGGGLALSSTAFALQVLKERRELTQPHGRAGFAVLLLQDLAVIPMLAGLPLLAPAAAEASAGRPAWMSVALAVGALVGLVAASRLLVRPVFRVVAGTGNRELSVALALFAVVGTSALMQAIGLSMALGAFVAGMMLADSEYRHELESNVAPFQGLLLGLFFTSVGMTADVRGALSEPALLLGATAALVAVKGALLYGLGRVSGLSGRAALLLGLTLGQGGEFGFVLFSAAAADGAIGELAADRALVVVTLSMVSTPLLLLAADAWLKRRPAAAAPDRPYDVEGYEHSPVIIAGFGRYGQMTGRTLRMMGIPFTALEIDPNHIDFVGRFGNKVFYGDAARLDLLHAAKAEHAQVLVVAVDDVDASIAIVRQARHAFPHLKVLARARNRTHAFALIDAGAHDVRRETLASGLETAAEALRALGYGVGETQEIVDRFREHDEETLRRQATVWQDDDKVLETARESAARLEKLFTRDVV